MKSLLFKNRENTNEIKSVRLNRRAITFFFCVLVASFFWLMLSLSKEYIITESFPVSYQNRPNDKVISNHLPATIDIEIKSNGFNLLGYKLEKHKETVYIDLKDARPLAYKNHYYLLCNSRIDKITAQFNNEIKILRINPDTVFFNFNKKVSKQVPVKINLAVDCEKEYQQTDPAEVDPVMITVSGDQEMLERVNHLETVPMKLKNVSAPLLLKMNILRTPDLSQVDLSQSFVHAKVNVAKYTEASVELPVEVENLPGGYSMKTFPDKITVKYNVMFDGYATINASQFRAIVDYRKIEQDDNQLKIQLVKHPDGIRAVKMSTEKVEYILRK